MADVAKQMNKKASQFLQAGEAYTAANAVVPVGDTFANAAALSGRIAGGLVGVAAAKVFGPSTEAANQAREFTTIELPKAVTVATTAQRVLLLEGHGKPKGLIATWPAAGSVCVTEDRSQRGVKTQLMLFSFDDGRQFAVEANVFGPARKLNQRLLDGYVAAGGTVSNSDELG